MHYKSYKSILSSKNGMNIYRGCTHGCIYCDSRSNCYQMDHNFEDIEVKFDAPIMLESELKKKRKKAMIGTGYMSDPYIHLETNLQYTKKCLEIIEKYSFGLAIQTKSNRILRDLDLLKKINEKSKCIVLTTMTTFDENLCKILEPNVSTTKERFEMLLEMKANKIPTVVWFSPFLPWINDNRKNIEGLLKYCIEAEVKGIIFFGIGLTLREGNREYFYSKLDEHFPGLKQKYIDTYGNSYECISPNSDELSDLIKKTCQSNNIMYNPNDIFSYLREYEDKSLLNQLSFFD